MSAIVHDRARHTRVETSAAPAMHGTLLRWTAPWLAMVGMQACSRPRAVPDGGKVDFALPGVAAEGSELVTHATACGDDVVFIAARIRYGNDTVDRQILGLFRASVAPGGTITVTRSDLAGTPADVFVHAGRCYAVTNHPRGDAFDVAIHELTSDHTWRARAQLTADAMARSGELLDGYFYLGLGCDPGHCTAAAGRILRIAAAP